MTLSHLVRRLPLGMRLGAFRAIEWASLLRRPIPQGRSGSGPASERSIWLYVTTIGELNAIEPFLRALLEALGNPPLTLLTNHEHYRAAYLTKFPGAAVEALVGSTPEVEALLKRRPPMMLIVAEIPCLLHDGPCRFSYATLHAVRRHGAPAVLVNGWLYGYAPASRIDSLEHHLFGRDYVREFDLMLVQTPEVRDRILAEGADPGRVFVTGNIKFDAMRSGYGVPERAPLREALAACGRQPIVVAGSVTELPDQAAMLEAFSVLKTHAAGAMLVLAPRHPENADRMRDLEGLLQRSGLGYRFRSRHSENDAVQTDVLVLDTMGELRGCYSVATFAFVGTDHNVLEPLSFGNRVFVSGGWEATYPSFPVYRQLLDAGVLDVVERIGDLGASWVAALQRSEGRPAGELSAAAKAVLAHAQGATARCMAALRDARLLGPNAGLRNSRAAGQASTGRPL